MPPNIFISAGEASGEHSGALLSELCGVDPDEIKRLREDGVV